MKRKYINRFVVWGLLIAVLTLITIYSSRVLIAPLDQEIEDLNEEINSLSFRIRRLQTQINQYHSRQLLTDEEIKKRLPELSDNTKDDRERIKQDTKSNYVERPVESSGGQLLDYRINIPNEENENKDYKPEHLQLSKTIKGIQIIARISFDREEHIYDYLNELNETIRSIYIESIRYNLPTENDLLNPSKPFVYVLDITYYTFYYPVS